MFFKIFFDQVLTDKDRRWFYILVVLICVCIFLFLLREQQEKEFLLFSAQQLKNLDIYLLPLKQLEKENINLYLELKGPRILQDSISDILFWTLSSSLILYSIGYLSLITKTCLLMNFNTIPLKIIIYNSTFYKNLYLYVLLKNPDSPTTYYQIIHNIFLCVNP